MPGPAASYQFGLATEFIVCAFSVRRCDLLYVKGEGSAESHIDRFLCNGVAADFYTGTRHHLHHNKGDCAAMLKIGILDRCFDADY